MPSSIGPTSAAVSSAAAALERVRAHLGTHLPCGVVDDTLRIIAFARSWAEAERRIVAPWKDTVQRPHVYRVHQVYDQALIPHARALRDVLHEAHDGHAETAHRLEVLDAELTWLVAHVSGEVARLAPLVSKRGPRARHTWRHALIQGIHAAYPPDAVRKSIGSPFETTVLLVLRLLSPGDYDGFDAEERVHADIITALTRPLDRQFAVHLAVEIDKKVK